MNGLVRLLPGSRQPCGHAWRRPQVNTLLTPCCVRESCYMQLPASAGEYKREKGNSVPLSVEGKCPRNSCESETQITHLFLFLSSRRVFCIFPLGKKIFWFLVKRRMPLLAFPLGCSEEETKEKKDF